EGERVKEVFVSAALTESMRRISGLLQAGQYGAAHAQLEALVAANPSYVEGLRLLAGTKQALGDSGQAESLLRRALEIDPGSTPAPPPRGGLPRVPGRSAGAGPLLRRAARAAPPPARPALPLARHYLERGQPALALAVAAPWCERGAADIDLAALHV